MQPFQSFSGKNQRNNMKYVSINKFIDKEVQVTRISSAMNEKYET